MAKIIKIQTGTADVVLTSEYSSEEAAQKDDEPTQCDCEVKEFKVETTRWKRGEIKKDE